MLDFRACDADNHYYEATDAFTRHIEPSMARRCMQWAELNGRQRLLVAGQINDFIPNPTFDPVAKPGSLQAFFKGTEQSAKDVKSLFGELEPIRAEYRQRDARLAVMDEQGLDAAWLFPTLGVGMEQSLLHDPAAIIAAFRAFNRWLDDDWGFAYRGRLFAAPYLSLVDLDAAVSELEWALDRGARIICVRTAPVTRGPSDPRLSGKIAHPTVSPFLEEFDAFWARVAEAGIVTAFHGGDTGYAHHVAAWEPAARGRAFFASPLQRVIAKNRAITETMAAAICHKVLDRHPRLRFAVVENGSAWLRDLLKKLDIAATQSAGWFRERPSDTFRRHVWVTPFWEDDPSEAAQVIGVERTLFGSDWPHAEGMAEPVSYADAIAALGDDAVRRIMRDNFRELTSPLR
jgi:predicted TIM-barrel fold metal-dependent hydrolase